MTNRRKDYRLKPIKQQQFVLKILDFEFDIKPENISAGGLFLQTDVELPVGMLIEIELVHEGKTAKSLARVQRFRGNGVGIAFVEPPAEFRQLIYRSPRSSQNVTKRLPKSSRIVLPDDFSWNKQ